MEIEMTGPLPNAGEKLRYEPPLLQEWGGIADITGAQGKTFLTDATMCGSMVQKGGPEC
jgi:hypothetical protein